MVTPLSLSSNISILYYIAHETIALQEKFAYTTLCELPTLLDEQAQSDSIHFVFLD